MRNTWMTLKYAKFSLSLKIESMKLSKIKTGKKKLLKNGMTPPKRKSKKKNLNKAFSITVSYSILFKMIYFCLHLESQATRSMRS